MGALRRPQWTQGACQTWRVTDTGETMATGSSMQYTIGTALDRAREGGLDVEVLVGNQWLSGQVAAADGLGVVLDRDGTDHFVVRLEQISAVRVGAHAPMLDTVEQARTEGPDRFDGAVPIPGPDSGSDATRDVRPDLAPILASHPRAMSA